MEYFDSQGKNTFIKRESKSSEGATPTEKKLLDEVLGLTKMLSEQEKYLELLFDSIKNNMNSSHIMQPIIIQSHQKYGNKKNIVCDYGSLCKNSGCPYKHPTECKFGDFCKNRYCGFIHAAKGNRVDTHTKTNPIDGTKRDCRFGSMCKNNFCNFAHVERDIQPETKLDNPKNRLIDKPIDGTKRDCRFGSMCKNKLCNFAHIETDNQIETNNTSIDEPINETKKDCRFADMCKNISCNFAHPPKQVLKKKLVKKTDAINN